MQLENRTFFITGAAGGIGKALVEALLERDAKKIYAADRETVQVADDPRVIKISLDITDLTQVESAARTTDDVEVLINNAGVAAYVGLLNGPIELLRRDMETNYFGTLNMMRAFIPTLMTKPKSAIVNVASIGAFVNYPYFGGYCASKAAIYSITQGARIALASKGISVHSVNPGPTDTAMMKDIHTPKTSAKDVANATLDGLQADEADIFPDPSSKAMFNLWLNHYRDLEKMVAHSIQSS